MAFAVLAGVYSGTGQAVYSLAVKHHMDETEKAFVEAAQEAGFTESQARFLWKQFGGGAWEGVNVAN